MNADVFAARVELQYSLYLASITAIYLTSVGVGIKVTPASLRETRLAMVSAEFDFLSWLREEKQRFLDSLHMNPDRAAMMQIFVDQGNSLLVRVRVWATSNRDMLQRRLALGDARMGASDEHGALGLLAQRQASRTEFKLSDAVGRQWSAEKLVRMTLRDWAYQAEIRVGLLISTSDLFQVRYSDPIRFDEQVVFSKTGRTPGYPTFEELADKVFHPNAVAMVSPYVPS